MQLSIDFNHLCYRTFFGGARKDIDDVGWGYFKHLVLSSIFSLCNRFDPDEVIIASDSKSNWRKQFYPLYKANREEKRKEQDDVDWPAFFGAMEELLTDMKAYFPFYVIQVKYMEADDIIGAIVKQNQSEEKIVVTSDSDYIQLLRYKNVKIFDAMKGAFMKSDSPEKDLKAKIIAGDSGDNVPNILKKSMDEKVKTRMGEKTAIALCEDDEKFKNLFKDETVLLNGEGNQIIDELTEGETVSKVPAKLCDRAKAGYKRNTVLIDLAYTPKKLIDAMNEELTNYSLPDGKSIFQYFMKGNYREFISKMETVERVVKKLHEAGESKKAFG